MIWGCPTAISLTEDLICLLMGCHSKQNSHKEGIFGSEGRPVLEEGWPGGGSEGLGQLAEGQGYGYFKAGIVGDSIMIKMSTSALDVVCIKNCIPEFIIKIYSILEKNEYQEIICWSQTNNEILIKDQKKLERVVLPLFFRHNKIESFIRQLNMYRFSKVNKMDKDRNHLYFKNEHFKKGNIESLVLIKRKRKGKDGGLTTSEDELSSSVEAENVDNYKEFVKGNIMTMQEELLRIRKNYPLVASEFTKMFQISNMLIGRDINFHIHNSEEPQDKTQAHLFHSNNDLFPERPSLVRLESCCSIDQDMLVDID